MGVAVVKCWSITFVLSFTDLPFASVIAIMSHDHDMRDTKQEEENYKSVALANLETKLLGRFSSHKDEEINLKDVIIRNFLEENAKLRSRVEVLENKFNHWE